MSVVGLGRLSLGELGRWFGAAAMTGGAGWLLAPSEDGVVRGLGWAAAVALAGSLAVGPWNRWGRRRVERGWRRRLGLMAFMWATLHLGWGWGAWGSAALWRLLSERTFAQAGGAAYLVLALMALTTPAGLIRSLRVRRWRALHGGVYAAVTFLMLHLALAPRTASLGVWLGGAALGALVLGRIALR